MKKGKLVFLDESGVNVNMTRFYGCAKGKKRVYDYVPAKRIKRTMILSIILDNFSSKTSKRLSGDFEILIIPSALHSRRHTSY